MLKRVQLPVLAMVGLLAAGSAIADDKVAATVNGVAIPQAMVDTRVKFAASQGQADTPELRKMIRDDLIKLELMSQAAKKSGLDKQPDVIEQLEMAKQSTLAGAFMLDYVKNHPISEDAVKQEYDRLKALHGPKDYRVAQIVVSTEAEAKAIEAQLKKKAKFDKLAKEKSIDPNSKMQGGEIGWNAPVSYAQAFGPSFADALTKLNRGEVSAPVQSQVGWHIIKLEDVRDWTPPPLEQVKPNLMQRLQQQAVQKEIDDLRNSAKIE
jgi:peptidyl-prolyl cis-trans isomerase C